MKLFPYGLLAENSRGLLHTHKKGVRNVNTLRDATKHISR